MDYDKILLELGEFGRWQQMNTLMLWIPAIVAGMNILIASFSVMEPRYGYRCRNACDNDTFYFDDFDSSSMFPSLDPAYEKYDDKTPPDYCEYYSSSLVDGECVFDKTNILSCERDAEFTYEEFEMDATIAIEKNLVCKNYFWIPTIDSFMMIGLLLGSFIFGVMSDKIGRRHTLVIAVLCCCVGNLIGCAMYNHWSYATARILSSAGGEGAFVLAFTMSLEYSGVKERVPCLPWVTYSTLLANFIGVPFALGETIPVFFGKYLKEWRTFQAGVSAAMSVACLVWFFLPESPRWLIANGKEEEAKKMIEKAAAINKVKLSPDVFVSKEDPGEDESDKFPVYGLKDLFRPSQLRITIAMFICWPVVTLLYYGLTLSADKIKMTDDLYLSYVLVALVEIPAYIFLPLIIDIWGRKPLFAFTQLVPGICCIVAAFLDEGVFFTILALGAKLGAAAAFNVTFMYTAQLYPTSIRNSAVGSCSTIARLGGLLSPWVGKYLPETGALPEEVPMCLFGGFGVLGGLCALMLPDTVGFQLPNTFEDIEIIKKNSKPMWKCGVSKEVANKKDTNEP